MSYHLTSPMPPVVSVICPGCGKYAEFEHATVQVIKKNIDVEFFKKSTFFEFRDAQGIPGYAIYYPRLGHNLQNLTELPDGYEKKAWSHNEYWLQRSDDMGVIQCNSCSMRQKHSLKWPDDAYFKVDYKNDWIWAFDRNTAKLLLDYIESAERNKTITGYINAKTHKVEVKGYHSFLLKIPEMFQTKKARPHIVKKLKRLLS